ncbi:MAG TPA: hypothetical protein VJU14_10845 [Solirubrobacterales bacterium]|nr:hypothetical protein [Solirubrobacterales bacterium]
MTGAAFQVWLEGQWDRSDEVGTVARFVDRLGLRLPEAPIALADLEAQLRDVGAPPEVLACLPSTWSACGRELDGEADGPPVDHAPDLPSSLTAAIEREVEQAGGDRTDARDLADVWVRVLRDCDRRAGGIRTATRLRGCSCADGGEPGAAGRCSRCFGRSRDRSSR